MIFLFLQFGFSECLVPQKGSSCTSGDLDLVKHLANDPAVNVSWEDPEYNRTPLYRACFFGRHSIIELLTELEKETGEAEKGLFTYLQAMKKFHVAFLDNDINWETREKMAKEAAAYFASLTKKVGGASKSPISDGLAEQIQTSVDSLISLHSKYPTTLKPSVYGTLVVENFFSTMRAKVRYPSLLEYAQTYHAAFRELVKKVL